MSNKTISINPSLFSTSGSKTKKNREKKVKPTVAPLISPNVLKNKLLKRIKEHKTKETHNLDNKKKTEGGGGSNGGRSNGGGGSNGGGSNGGGSNGGGSNGGGGSSNSIGKKDVDTSFTDEFTDSINYLQTLTTQKKTNEEKERNEREKQIRRENIQRNTVKNYHSMDTSSQQNFVNIELPEELSQPLIKINTDQVIPNITLKSPYVNDTVPYGILKGGTKPTFRDWSKTQRNLVVTNPNAALTIQGGNIQHKTGSERESRLHNLREKLKQKQIEEQIQTNENMMMTQNLIQKPEQSSGQSLETINSNDPIIGIKQIFKKTTKKKYTLGRSKTKNCVGVLVKDRGTRKQVILAQKDLKRKPINDVKTYLRDHNLIKVGSNAPNDVVRKIYESAMLAGEITNSNTDILLHNFSKDDKEF